VWPPRHESYHVGERDGGLRSGSKRGSCKQGGGKCGGGERGGSEGGGGFTRRRLYAAAKSAAAVFRISGFW
jgi:hypothetical protein